MECREPHILFSHGILGKTLSVSTWNIWSSPQPCQRVERKVKGRNEGSKRQLRVEWKAPRDDVGILYRYLENYYSRFATLAKDREREIERVT